MNYYRLFSVNGKSSSRALLMILIVYALCERSGDGVLHGRKSPNGSRVLQLPVPAGSWPGAVVHIQRAVLRVRSPLRHHFTTRPISRVVRRSRVPAATKPRPPHFRFRSRDRHRAAVKRTTCVRSRLRIFTYLTGSLPRRRNCVRLQRARFS